MSRRLPNNPNLEHLRKQAKNLLAELRQQNSNAKLADALHEIAREYGFASWPKLKAHVASLPRVTNSARANPFVGTWQANLARSRRHPENQFQTARLNFEVAGDIVTITHVVIDASGREERGQNTVHVDGREHADHASGYLLMAEWRGSRVLETVAKKDGQVVGRGTYEVSADGTTLTFSTRDPASNADGWKTEFQQVIVLECV